MKKKFIVQPSLYIAAVCAFVFTSQVFATSKAFDPENIIYTTEDYIVTCWDSAIPVGSTTFKKMVGIITTKNNVQVGEIGPLPGQLINGISVSNDKKIIISQEDYTVDEDIGCKAYCYRFNGTLLWSHGYLNDNTFFILSPDGNYATNPSGTDIIFLSGNDGQPVELNVPKKLPVQKYDKSLKNEPRTISPIDSGLAYRTSGYIGYFTNSNFLFFQNNSNLIQAISVPTLRLKSKKILENDTAIFHGLPVNRMISYNAKSDMIAFAFKQKRSDSTIILISNSPQNKIQRLIFKETVQQINLIDSANLLYIIPEQDKIKLKMVRISDSRHTLVDDDYPSASFQSAYAKDGKLYYKTKGLKGYRSFDLNSFKRTQLLDTVPLP